MIFIDYFFFITSGAYKQQVWRRTAAVSISVKGLAKTLAMPSVTPITVAILETEIKEFYVLIQSTKMFNE